MGQQNKSEPDTAAPADASDAKSGERWFDIIKTLSNSSPPDPDHKPRGPHSDLNICSTVRQAIAAAERDPAWADSGVVAHLQSALDIATQGDCPGAKAAALGLTDFVSIAQRNAPAADPGGGVAPQQDAQLASSEDMPWSHGEQDAGIHKSASWDACSLGTEALHTRSEGSRGSGGGDSPTEQAAAAAVAAVDSGDEDGGGGQPTADGRGGSSRGGSREGRKSPLGASGTGRGHSGGSSNTGSPGRGLVRNWVSDGNIRPSKRQRAESPPLPPRSLSDPGTPLRRTSSASAIALQAMRFGGGGSSNSSGSQQARSGAGGSATAIASTAAADEGFPGHNSVVDVHPASKLLRQAKNATEGGADSSSYWAGKVKHRLGSSTVELFFLSALLPTVVIEHMPPSLFVTDLVQRNSLAIGSEHTVIRCRLDFLTNRQLRKLRTLAELRLAAVSSLQHCAITLVPYLDAQRGLRIIGFVKVDKT